MDRLANRRVKIVATIGPATCSRENLAKAIKAGMNVARLNFSHGAHEEHRQVIHDLRSLSEELKSPIAIMQDLQGPKIRVGRLEGGKVELHVGQKVTLTHKNVQGNASIIPIDYAYLAEACKKVSKILLDDGLLELKVVNVHDKDVECEVVFGGILKDRKGVNVPGGNLSIDCLLEKDLKDLEFGLSENVDYIALSFVRKGDDIRRLRELINCKRPETRIVAKIEMLEALDNLEEIIRLSDAVMVARGDLAVEVGQSLLPGIQKEIIHKANQLGTSVITATQMLDSMVSNPRPTRAEITDVANAVLDGSDAVMLSAESASGKYPFECIRTMHNIIVEVERRGFHYNNISLEDESLTIPAAIGASACLSAMKMDAVAIVCLTTTGQTARIISSFRPKARLIAITDILPTLNRLEFVWGLQTLIIPVYKSLQDVLDQIEKLLVQYGIAKVDDRIVFTLGAPVRDHSKTNSIIIHQIKDRGYAKLPDDQLPLRLRPLSNSNL